MSNVSVSIGHDTWTFKSDGIPPTGYVAPYYAAPTNPDAVSAVGATIHASSQIAKDQNYDYTLPLTPRYSKHTTQANMGPIGVALDGAAFFNPYEENDTEVATADNFITTSGGISASFLDDCDGHFNGNGQYHYHGMPSCLVAYATGESQPAVGSVTSTAGTTTAGVSFAKPAAKKPVLLGFAFDGYGIYDNVAMNGKSIPASKLDACNGIFSAVPGYPHGVYHYVLENIKGARADIACYHGVVSSAYTKALQGATGGGTTGSSGPPPNGTPPPGGGPPNGNPPPNGGPPPSSQARQTAVGLAANTNEDDLLRAALAVGGNLCG